MRESPEVETSLIQTPTAIAVHESHLAMETTNRVSFGDGDRWCWNASTRWGRERRPRQAKRGANGGRWLGVGGPPTTIDRQQPKIAAQATESEIHRARDTRTTRNDFALRGNGTFPPRCRRRRAGAVTIAQVKLPRVGPAGRGDRNRQHLGHRVRATPHREGVAPRRVRIWGHK